MPSTPEEKKKVQMMINILWLDMANKGAIEVDEQKIEPSALQEMITKRKAINPDFRVIIRADKRAKYAYVRSIMVALGGAGVPNVTFSAVDKETENKPKPTD